MIQPRHKLQPATIASCSKEASSICNQPIMHDRPLPQGTPYSHNASCLIAWHRQRSLPEIYIFPKIQHDVKSMCNSTNASQCSDHLIDNAQFGITQHDASPASEVTYLLHELMVTCHHSCYDISMSVQVLGCALNYNINAQICRPVSTAAASINTPNSTFVQFCVCIQRLCSEHSDRYLPYNCRAGKCVVNDADNIPLLTEGSHSRNICYIQQRVANSFYVEHL